MNINDAFPSQYLEATDLKGRSRSVTIDDVGIEDLGDGEHKPVVRFRGVQRGYYSITPMPRTWLQAWAMKRTAGLVRVCIQLYPTEVLFQGRAVPSIRVRPVPNGGHQPAGAAPASDLDSYVPW